MNGSGAAIRNSFGVAAGVAITGAVTGGFGSGDGDLLGGTGTWTGVRNGGVCGSAVVQFNPDG